MDGKFRTTKQYLNQLVNIDKRIKDKIKEAEMWRDIAGRTGGGSNSERVQTTKRYDKMGDAISSAVDYEQESERLAKELVEIKNTIIQQIDGIEDQLHYNILKDYYIHEMALVEIAAQEHYSYKQTGRHFKNALNDFEHRYGSTYLRNDVQKCPQMS